MSKTEPELHHQETKEKSEVRNQKLEPGTKNQEPGTDFTTTTQRHEANPEPTAEGAEKTESICNL